MLYNRIYNRKLDKRIRSIPAPQGTCNKWMLDTINQPHALIAGTTGAGKSVLLHDLVRVILLGHPTAREMVLIDTKRIELRRYMNLPHTRAYANTVESSIEALKDAVDTMESRYQRLESGYPESDLSDIYILIDDLGDLVLQSREAIPLLSRIAMVGRAVHVHLIGCTQNPNRKILSPQIEGNCPVHIGLRCKSPIETRQIIGTADASTLPMYGKGYFVSPQYIGPQMITVPVCDPTPLVNYWLNAVR